MVFSLDAIYKYGGSLNIAPGGMFELGEPMYLACEVMNQGYLFLIDLQIAQGLGLPFENQGYLGVSVLVNNRIGVLNSGVWDVGDTLINTASIVNSAGASWSSDFRSMGPGTFINQGYATFQEHMGPEGRFMNSDTLDLWGWSVRYLENVGYVTLGVATVDTMLNSGDARIAGPLLIEHEYQGDGLVDVFNVQSLTIDTAATCTNNAPGLVIGTGDLINYGLINGSGSFCISLSTENFGAIDGTVDLCDLSPTTVTPPLVDLNLGTIGAGVTYCSSSACSTGFHEVHSMAGIVVTPNPAHDVVAINGSSRGTSISIFDAMGRALSEIITLSEQTSIDISMLQEGCYLLMLDDGLDHRVLRLIVE